MTAFCSFGQEAFIHSIIDTCNFYQVMYQQLSKLIEGLATSIGLQVDIVKTILVMLVNIPLGALYPTLTNPILRLLYSLILGLLELFFLLQYDASYVIGVSLITFLMIKIVNQAPFLTSIICSVIALTIIHLQRFLFDYSSWKMDCSVYVMVLVTKLTYYGFAVRNNKGGDFSVLSFFAYCFFFPSLLVGPTFSFERFLDFINLDKQYKNIKFSMGNTLRVFIQGVAISVLTAFVMPVFDHEWVIRNEQYKAYPLIGKLVAMSVIGFFYRVKFYAAWYLTQTTINVSGLSYSENGKNDSVVTGSIMFEFEPNPKNKTEYWNSSVQVWLKTIVYDNIAALTKNQTLAVFGTFFTSAFWHGIYLSYYFGFIQWAILVQLTKFFYKLSFYFPKSFRQSLVATGLVWFAGTITINYIGMAIVVLEWDNLLAFYSDLYFCITILLVVFLALSFVVKTPKQPRDAKKSSAKEVSTPEIKKVL